MSCKQWRDDRKQQCAQEADLGYSKCTEERDLGYSKCTEERDNGYTKCTEERDNGYNACAEWRSQCCTWWPCSWACEAISWLCVGWTWISNVVCVASVWVANVVCVAAVWMANVVCVLWTEIGNVVCIVWENIRGEPPPWAADVRDPVDLSNLPAFPRDFLWGAATAAYQVEGRITNNDWDSFTTSPAIARRVFAISSRAGAPFQLRPPGEAVQHYSIAVLCEDLDRAVALGLRAYRFSIEWSRVQPDPPVDATATWNDNALQYYTDVIREVRERQLVPIVTLNHLTLPKWVLDPPRESVGAVVDGVGFGSPRVDDPTFQASRRGWENPANIDLYVEFVTKVVQRFRNHVNVWITFNEPVGSMIGAGYLAGVWSPGFTANVAGPEIALTVYRNILRAHVKAYDAIKQIYGAAPCQVGIVQNVIYVKKAGGGVWPSVRDGALAGAATGAAIGAVAGAAGPGPLIGGVLVGAGTGVVVGATVGLGVGIEGHTRAARQYDYFNHWHLLDSLIGDTVDNAFQHEEEKRDNVEARAFYGLPNGPDDPPWRPRLDFIGVNYYRSAYVHKFIPLTLFARYMGGMFEQDYNLSKDPHNLVNGMGWEISPEGLYYVLTDMAKRYSLPDDQPFPIMITEHGLPEPADANRAPYTIAHLEHVLAAIRDGARVTGYLHWSLLDNFEWAENYAARAKFGLFRVVENPDDPWHQTADRLPRRISEGALALQYMIAEDAAAGDTPQSEREAGRVGIGLAAKKFGTIASDGSAVVAPALTAGAFLTGRLDSSPAASTDFTIYLNPLSPLTVGNGSRPRWLGMVFLHDIGRWRRLDTITWHPAERQLRLAHGVTTYVATLGTDGLFRGTVKDRAGPARPWQARKVLGYGVWAGADSVPSTIILNQLEGSLSGWTGKYLRRTHYDLPFWFQLDRVHVDDKVGFELGAGGADGLFEGELRSSGSALSGTINGKIAAVRSGEWSGDKLPDDMPF